MAFTRRRALLGTFITITCESDESAVFSSAVTKAFAEAERLESVFSAIDPGSVLNRYNAAGGKGHDWPVELTQLISRALDLRRASENFFNPYRAPGVLDLAGIAKGAVVDYLVELLSSNVADFNGVVNAGGDLRFIGSAHRAVSARVGAVDTPILRPMILCAPHAAFASSSFTVAEVDEKSSTRYHLPLAQGLTKTSTACVAARECWVADGLTKVALHAPADVADRVARAYEATMVLFDGDGEVLAVRGQAPGASSEPKSKRGAP